MVDAVNLTPELNPESPEYVAEMAKKGEAAVNGGVQPEPTPVIAQKPEGVPDKFYNATTGEVDYASLTKSYVELEKSKSKPPEPPKVPEVKPIVDPAKPVDAAQAVAEAGLDMSSLNSEYQSNGELTQESYDKLAKAGITADVVDGYIEGQKARVQVMQAEAHAVTEGKEGYEAMIDWAKANATPTEIQAYNKAVNSTVQSERELAVRGMWSRYGADSGNTGNLVTNKVNLKGGDGSYESRAQMMSDMQNPKYKTDPAFRKTVEAKLANSNIFQQHIPHTS